VISVESAPAALSPVENAVFSPHAIHGANRLTEPVRGVFPVVHNAYYVYEGF
jgi:hypothetical protein